MSTLESIYPKRSFFDNLNHVLDFQINDLKRALIDAKANFLVAQGCMNTIEFLGGIQNGNLGRLEPGYARARFEEGLSLLSGENGVRLLSNLTEPVDTATMWKLRCGLTHQYLPKLATITGIFIGVGTTPGVKYDVVGEIARDEKHVGIKKGLLLMVDLAALIRAIEEGRKKLLEELKSDKIKRLKAEKALSRLPELL